MVARVLIIGGYGNFGSYIARSLASDPRLALLIAGRSLDKARAFLASLASANAGEAHAIDIDIDVAEALKRARPDIVVHTTGPFQHQDYRVAHACIAHGCHYIDLADARAFVSGIGTLDVDARAADVLVVSGASSVPCLSAAVLDDMRPAFARIDAVDYGISAAQQTNRGLATTTAVLSYVGKPFRSLRGGRFIDVFGWQETHAVRYPELGVRLFGNCDIPDLELFPHRYPELRDMRFAAGHELKLLHLGTWLLGWAVRLGLLRSLDRYADPLLKLAFAFDRFGSGQSGFHMFVRGVDASGGGKTARFHLVARSGHGPHIPCMPAILLAQQLAEGQLPRRGAMPCLDLITLDQYLDALAGLDISVYRDA